MSPSQPTIKPATLADSEPQAGQVAMPVWMIVALLVIFFAGALYFDANGGWFSQQVYAPYHSEQQLALFQPASDADRAMQRGKVVFEQICALCHGVDGNGKPGQAPPFVGSEWVLTDNLGHLIRIPLNGVSGPIKVKGETWALAMPAMGASLSDDDLAAVLTYMRGSWGNKAPEVTPDQVKSVRSAIGGRTQPWSADELLKLQ